MNSCIYNGVVTHTRFKPVKHLLKYKTFSFFIDLDEIEKLDKSISIFSLNKFNIFSFYNKDHGDRDGGCLRKWVLANLSKFNIKGDITKIKILCYPRIFGYVFNPLSIFYCYDEKSQLKAVLYEVKNTFNEQHTYIFLVNENSNIVIKTKSIIHDQPTRCHQPRHLLTCRRPTATERRPSQCCHRQPTRSPHRRCTRHDCHAGGCGVP